MAEVNTSRLSLEVSRWLKSALGGDRLRIYEPLSREELVDAAKAAGILINGDELSSPDGETLSIRVQDVGYVGIPEAGAYRLGEVDRFLKDKSGSIIGFVYQWSLLAHGMSEENETLVDSLEQALRLPEEEDLIALEAIVEIQGLQRRIAFKNEARGLIAEEIEGVDSQIQYLTEKRDALEKELEPLE